jgi:hypothetical protein
MLGTSHTHPCAPLLTRGVHLWCLGVSGQVYPMERISEAADFLKECGDCFQDSHSLRLKHAFAELFIALLSPIAEVGVARRPHTSVNARASWAGSYTHTYTHRWWTPR